jgi:hypothetical protein
MLLGRVGLAAVIAVGVGFGSVALAQDAGPACSVGFSGMSVGLSAHLSSAPYFATAKTTYERDLADGNSIQGYAITHSARDGQGRTRTEHPVGCNRGEDGQPRLASSITVNDPVAKTGTFWNVNFGGPPSSNVVNVFHQMPQQPLNSERKAVIHHRAGRNTRRGRPDIKFEDLGERNIAGVDAKGSRTTQTIPAGEFGNALPIVVVTEQWVSAEYGIVMMGTEDDPRFGKTVYEVTDFVPGEPDASLFAPPADYKVRDITPVAQAVGQ